MGAYIFQDNKPTVFWSCKLHDTQFCYTVGDKEVLSVVMVLTELCIILLDAVLHIHTDHLYITTPLLTVSFAGSITLNNLTLTFTYPQQRQCCCWYTLLARPHWRIYSAKRQTSIFQRLHLQRNGLCQQSTPHWMLSSLTTIGSTRY